MQHQIGPHLVYHQANQCTKEKRQKRTQVIPNSVIKKKICANKQKKEYHVLCQVSCFLERLMICFRTLKKWKNNLV